MTFGLAVAHTRERTGGSLKLRDGIDRIENGDADIPGNVRFETTKEIAREIKDGQNVLPPILIGVDDGSEMAVVEGNTRIAAYEMSRSGAEINALLGTAPIYELRKRVFFLGEAIYWR